MIRLLLPRERFRSHTRLRHSDALDYWRGAAATNSRHVEQDSNQREESSGHERKEIELNSSPYNMNAHGARLLRRNLGRALRATGLDTVLIRRGLDFWRGGTRNRNQYAARYLRGKGLEVGALHNPQNVARDAEVQYVDRLSFEQCTARFPNLDPTHIVRPSIIDDGFVLQTVDDASEDFVIANHVLEHSLNPLQVLCHWARVLRRAGVLFVTVPIGEACFDRGRAPTPLDHFIEDYRLCAEGQTERFKQRNREHYLEWVRISEPAIAGKGGSEPPMPSDQQLVERAELMLDHEVEIHFHTFSVDSFKRLLDYFCAELDHRMRVKEYAPIVGEIVSVLEKTD